MENYGLLEWQKDLVRNGNYDLTSFEEEDIVIIKKMITFFKHLRKL